MTLLLSLALLLFPATSALSAGPQTQPSTAPAKAPVSQLPPPPPGHPTVIGGTIEKLDPIRDQFVLKIFGGKDLKVVYDPRTSVYKDGVRQSLLSLKNRQIASVETTLDGTAVFALSIHTLSHTQTGECKGQVVRANPALGQITVRCGMSPDSVVFRVAADASVSRISPIEGVAPTPISAQDINAGALVSIRFEAAPGGAATATSISLLASPGMPFVFAGKLTFLDRHDGRMTVETSPGASYTLHFAPGSFPQVDTLKVGSSVRVTAVFDGSGYRAQDVESE